MKTGKYPGIILLLLVLAPLATSSGKVFWQRLAAKTTSIFDTAGNWTQIYKSPMIINGARASLSVYGCEDALRTVAARLKQGFSTNNKNDLVAQGLNENMAQFATADDNRVTSLLMLAMPASDQSVIFELNRPREEHSKTALPSESAVFGRSFPAGCRLEATIRNEETRALLETLTSVLPPQQAFNGISAYLAGNGWSDIAPAAGIGSAKAYFRIYQRKDILCIVTVAHALRENRTCVTILSKEIKRK